MCNAVSKMILSACLAGLITTYGCNSQDAKMRQQAKEMYTQAENAFQSRDYQLASELLDTLAARYPKAVEVQREAMHLRPMVIEGKTIREIESCDSLIAALQMEKAAMDSRFTFVNNPQLVEGYYLSKAQPTGNLFASNGIEARISPDGEFYMLSSVTGRNIKHTSITLTADSESITSEVVSYDGERNYRSGANEMITYNGPKCDSIGMFVASHPASAIIVTYNGAGSFRLPLSPSQRDAIRETYEMASIMSQLASSRRKREYLDRQLMLARDQAARTLRDSTDSGK